MDFNHFLTSYMPDTSIGSRQHFKNMLEECVTAEKLGYATVSIPEHHLINLLMMPSPLQMAVKIASNSKYGLHASVFTQDIDRAFHLAKSLPCGTVSVNTFSEGDIKTPFGGYKQSGSLSRDQGTEALNSFLQTKTIWISHS